MNSKEPVREQTTAPAAADTAKPRYEPPQIIAYDESALADIVGPAVACARWNPVGGRR